jgi:predicted ATPase
MNSKIIAYTGVHGTGKTTAVYEAAAQYKKQGYNVGIIFETARKCPLPVLSLDCKKPSVHAQQWIFARQMQEEIEAAMHHDIVISDRTIVDVIAYTRHFQYRSTAYAMESMASQFSYKEVHFKMLHANDYCFDDGFRYTEDLELRCNIERIMIGLYEKLMIPLIFE